MTLHSCLYALKTTVDSSQLELIIEQFDRKLGETTMRDKWLRLRPHFVGQVSLIGLRQRLGMSLEEDMVEDRHLKRISLQQVRSVRAWDLGESVRSWTDAAGVASQWPDEVQALFGYFGYSQRPSELVVPDADARNETGFQTFVYQVHKLQDDLKSFASKGDSAKVRVPPPWCTPPPWFMPRGPLAVGAQQPAAGALVGSVDRAVLGVHPRGPRAAVRRAQACAATPRRSCGPGRWSFCFNVRATRHPLMPVALNSMQRPSPW